ncbi:nuclease-related domain-containing protein [Lysinibacillus antri]|nr:nuclease-related domain-containing protein [Lysinibacillus antri]
MFLKTRTESTELQILNSLNIRMQLSDKDKQYYYNLKKGYEGECLFDTFIEKLQCDCLVLNDLLLKTNNSTYQIDSLLILSDSIDIFEVKNFEGDYYYQSDRIYKRPKTEIMNPLTQLTRTESLFRQLLQNLGYRISINAYVVFINPEFTLYQSPLDKPFIFPTQIHRYLKQLNTIPSKLSRNHRILADKLLSLHLEDSPFKQIPAYDYDRLQKGIMCGFCNSLLDFVEGNKCICVQCGHPEIIESAVMRSVKEFKLLFPDKKITTNIIHDWCNAVPSKRRISRILNKNFQMVGVHQWAYYV